MYVCILVAQKVDKLSTRPQFLSLRLITLSTRKILTHWMAELHVVFLTLIYWIMIYLVDSAIRRLEN